MKKLLPLSLTLLITFGAYAQVPVLSLQQMQRGLEQPAFRFELVLNDSLAYDVLLERLPPRHEEHLHPLSMLEVLLESHRTANARIHVLERGRGKTASYDGNGSIRIDADSVWVDSTSASALRSLLPASSLEIVENPAALRIAVDRYNAQVSYIGADLVTGEPVDCWQIVMPVDTPIKPAHRLCLGTQDRLPRRFLSGALEGATWHTGSTVEIRHIRAVPRPPVEAFRLALPERRPVRSGMAPLPAEYQELYDRLRASASTSRKASQ